MVFEFLESGQFKVVLGKSFDVKPKKKAQKFFNVKRKCVRVCVGVLLYDYVFTLRNTQQMPVALIEASLAKTPN